MKRLAKDTVTPFGQSKPPIYLGWAGRESLPARAPHRAGDGLVSGHRVNLLERYDYPEGSYAVSIGHDLNGNKRVDTNFIGLPTEQWGVSNNARPSLRAPRFDEAVFKVAADAKEWVIDIKVAK
jgi:uncharacterized protein (DUF2141 family)